MATKISLSANDFRLGCIERYGDMAITWENGSYMVRGFAPDGAHCTQGFRDLQTARAYAKHPNIR